MRRNERWKREFIDAVFTDSMTSKLREKVLQKRPLKLFQFRTGSYILNGKTADVEALKNNEVWASAASEFNDPYDCALLIDKLNYHVILNSKEYIKKSIEIPRHTYVSCFSEDLYSLPMWSYYAKSHEGFCVAYNTMELKEVVLPVLYVDKPIYIPLNKEGSRFYPTVIKSDQWKHEREWRMVRNEAETEEHKKGIMLKSAKPAAIYLGSKINFALEKELTEFCRSEDIPIFKMYMNISTYKLYEKTI